MPSQRGYGREAGSDAEKAVDEARDNIRYLRRSCIERPALRRLSDSQIRRIAAIVARIEIATR
jgi:hypothetical protein